MTTQAIIYSPSNIDSCLASSIMKMHLEKDDHEVKVFPYNRSGNSFEAPTDFSVVHVLGADLAVDDLSSVLKGNPEAVYNLYNYSNSTVYPAGILLPMAESHRFKEHTDVGADGFKISVSSRICAMLSDTEIPYSNGGDLEGFAMIKEYAGIISLYMAFRPMTSAQTLFLYSNINGVRKAALGLKKLVLEKRNTTVKTEQYTEYVHQLRSSIESNMAMSYYAGANGKGYRTPTICVGERDAMHAMRFISYAHNEVISYEDNRSSRVYRVLSKENMKWYVKRFEPSDIWSEGSLTYLKTELPQHVR